MFDDLRHRLRALLRRDAMEASLREELEAHLDHLTEKHLRSGLSPQEARRQARLEFGGLDQVKEDCRDARGVHFLETIAQDLRYAVRLLRASPAFTLVAVLILALGIGAGTAIFSLFEGVLLRPIPVSHPAQLVVFRWQAHHSPDSNDYSDFGDCGVHGSGHTPSGCSFPLPLLQTLQTRARGFTAVTAFAGTFQIDVSGHGTPSLAQGEVVAGNYFSTLGVGAALGRTLLPADDRASAAPVVVLSDEYWHRAFGGDRSVLGQTLVLNNVPFTVVGVAQRSFTRLSPGKPQDFWMPIAMAPRLGIPWIHHIHTMKNWWIVLLGRLQPGVRPAQAQASTSLLFRNAMLHGAKPLSKAADNPVIQLVPAQQGLTGRRYDLAQPLNVLMLAVGLILLITCANIAGLLLARSSARSREIAVRLAIGASRARIVRQLLTESLLLALAGGAPGVALGDWGMRALITLMSSVSREPFHFTVALNGRVLVFALTVSLVTGLLFGLAPAWQATRVDLTPSLKDGLTSSAASSGSRPGRAFSLRNLLVVTQVALSVVVLTGAGLLLRTLGSLEAVNPGFDTHNVLLFALNPTLEGYKTAHIQSLYRRVRDRLAALPAVVSVSYSSEALLTGSLWITSVHFPGAPHGKHFNVDTLATGPAFFKTMHIPLLEGRQFTAQDYEQADASARASSSAKRKKPAAPPAIPVLVNREFVRRYFPAANPLGKIVIRGSNDHSSGDAPVARPPSPRYEIVGVTGNTRYDTPSRAIHPLMFVPLTGGGVHFEIRAAGSASALTPAIRHAVAEVDARLPLYDVHTQTEEIGYLLGQKRLVARLGSLFGGMALLLACVGLYGLVAYETSRRRREVGIRIALGAERSSILTLILGHGMKLTLAGLLLGLGASLLLTRSLASLLYGVGPLDPLTFLTVSLLLAAIALLACVLPARRATRVDPMTVLRCE